MILKKDYEDATQRKKINKVAKLIPGYVVALKDSPDDELPNIAVLPFKLLKALLKLPLLVPEKKFTALQPLRNLSLKELKVIHKKLKNQTTVDKVYPLERQTPDNLDSFDIADDMPPPSTDV